MGWQVDGVSFLGKHDGTYSCEDSILKITECGELSAQPPKIQGSCLVEDTKPSEVCNELEETVQTSEVWGSRDWSSPLAENCQKKVKLKWLERFLLSI